MTESGEKTDFLFLAGHPSLDFLNTRPLVRGQPVELLPSLEEFLRWLTRAGPHRRPRRRPTRSSAGTARRRASARRRARAGVSRDAAPHDGRPRPRARRFDRGRGRDQLHPGRERRQPPSRAPGRRVSDAIRRAADEPRSPCSAASPRPPRTFSRTRTLHLVRRCGNPDCVLFFFDTTRNHRRQWCSMGTCGNLMKVRAFRRRHRKTRVRRRSCGGAPAGSVRAITGLARPDVAH